jgi:hypothetical protein
MAIVQQMMVHTSERTRHVVAISRSSAAQHPLACLQDHAKQADEFLLRRLMVQILPHMHNFKILRIPLMQIHHVVLPQRDIMGLAH